MQKEWTCALDNFYRDLEQANRREDCGRDSFLGPATEIDPCLRRETLQKLSEVIDVPAPAFDALCLAAQRVEESPELKGFLDTCHHLIFGYKPVEAERQWVNRERLIACMGTSAIMFPVLVLLSNFDPLAVYYKEREIGREIWCDTLSDMAIWMNRCHKKYGVWGLEEFSWLKFHFQGRLFRLGRLQFMPGSLHDPIKVFKHYHTGRVAALLEEGVETRRDGNINGTNGGYEEHPYLTQWYEDDRKIAGTMIQPRGISSNANIQLLRSEWELVLAKGDPVMEVHIPEGERLDHTLCGASFKQAVGFFKDHFPEICYKAFTCESWLLDPQLQKILPAESNLARFQREFYLIPYRGDDNQTFERVFETTPSQVHTIAPRTSLQRAIYQYIKAGHSMHEGAMFLLKEDVSSWGSQVYEHEAPELVAMITGGSISE